MNENLTQSFKFKNPWSHVRWRGNYSELDVVHWTEELKNLMNYNPENAAAFDNGVFFIDYVKMIFYWWFRERRSTQKNTLLSNLIV